MPHHERLLNYKCQLALIVVALLAPLAQAQTFYVLYNFNGSADGGLPGAGVIEDPAGDLYGTATSGGNTGNGVVFKIDTSGKETVLHSFTGRRDGANPVSPLTLDETGILYGTAYNGGQSGYGVVFKIDTSRKLTVLHSFRGGATDGCYPSGGMKRSKAGNLYGTTAGCGAFNNGTVFEISQAGKETVLHSFAGGTTDGCNPFGGLNRDSVGNLYGTTTFCGAHALGTVFKISRAGKETVLYSFGAGTGDGCYPYAAPAKDSAHNLYGTTDQCGSGSSAFGTVWEVSAEGKEQVLYTFTGGSDGAYPTGGVVRDSTGNLYGNASQGGTYGWGTVYELNSSTLTVLHTFAYTDGAFPGSGVFHDAKGNLYGTSNNGGTGDCNGFGCGTVWSYVP